ncbi:MAG: hypothetical protein QME48_07515 [bacterium]|nr:hypothetical protein [bacterium]
MKNKIFLLILFLYSIKIFPSFDELIKKLDFYEDSLQIRTDSILLADYKEKTIDYMINKLKSSNWYFKNISIRVLKKVNDKNILLSKLFENGVDRIFIMKIFEDDKDFDPFKTLKFEDLKPYEISTYISYIEKRNRFEDIVEILNKESDDYVIVKSLQSLNSICLKDSFFRSELIKNQELLENLIKRKNLRINKNVAIILSNFFYDSFDNFFNETTLMDLSTFSLYLETFTLLGKEVDMERIEKFYNHFRRNDFYYLDSVVKKYFENFSLEKLKKMKDSVANEFLKAIIIEMVGNKNG